MCSAGRPRRGTLAVVTEPTSILPCASAATWGPAIDEAVHALSRGALVVVPTDTVYGLAADAFNPAAVAALLSAKGRGRQMPPPVLVPDARTLDGLATSVSDDVRALVAGFWPGGLTIICRAHSSLASAAGWSGIRIATVPAVSPRSHASELCARQMMVRPPGQKPATSARTSSDTLVA